MTNESNFPAVFFEDFLAALRKVQDENRIHGNVEVFELRPSPDGAVHLGVSWPSIGTVPPEEAKKFAEEVARAAAAAAAFPYNGYVYTFEYCLFDELGCGGQFFTTGVKLFRRRGRWYAYHFVSVDM